MTKNKKQTHHLSHKQKSQLKKWSEEAQIVMNMQNWDITLQYIDESCDGLFMQARTQQDYLRLVIVIFEKNTLDTWKSDGDDFIEQGIYHEICHALHAEFRALAFKRFVNDQQLYDAEERMCESFARIIYKLKK